MANKLTFTIDFDDKGSATVVVKESEKVAKSVKKVATAHEQAAASTKKHAKGRDAWNRQAKGAAQITSNSTKAFSKQAQSIGGSLVPAYATLAANVFALTAAFGALSNAAALEQLEAGLIAVGSAAGQNLPYVAKGLKEITGAAVSLQAAMSATALGISSGFRTDQLEDLTRVAKGASLALGRNLEDALTRLVKGTAKLEPEILDELGIMVRLDTAVDKYAVTLGKSATQLTQFERRQAFLNETIEQGLDKFGAIEKSIDPNTYDQLGSTFNDLNKTFFILINKGLQPVAEFFSKNEFALTGALIVFGATITKSLIPALDLAVTKQRVMAAESAATFKKAAHISTAAFKKASKEIGDLKFAPKGIKAVEEGMRAGTLSAVEMDKAITSMGRSVQLRGTNILKLEAQIAAAKSRTLELSGLEHQANIKLIADLEAKVAIKKTEYDLNQAALLQLKQAAALQKGSLVVSEKGVRAKVKSRMSTRTASAMQIMEGGGLKTSFAAATKAASRNAAEVKKVSGVYNKLAVSAKVATSSVRLFGRALLAAIPMLGTAIMLGSLLVPVWDKFFGKGAVAKAADEVTESFKSFNDIAAQLSVTLGDDLTSAAHKFIASMRVEVGIINQVIAGMKKVQQTRSDEDQEKILKITRERLDVLAGIAYLERTGGAGDPGELKAKQNRLAELNKELREVRDNLEQIDKAQALVILGDAIARIDSMAAGPKAALQEIQSQFRTLELQIANTSQTENPMKYEALIDKLKELMKIKAKVVAAVDDSRLAVAAFNKEVNKLNNKPLTVFDRLADSAEMLFATMQAASAKGMPGLQGVLEENEDFAEELKRIYTNMTGRDFMFASDYLKTMQFVRDTLKQNRLIIIDTRGEVKILEEAHKNVKSISSENAHFMEESLNLEIDINRRKALGIQKILETQQLLEVETKLKEDLAALDEKHLTLVAKKEAEIGVARIKEAKRLWGYQNKIVQSMNTMFRTKQAMLQVDLAARAALTNAKVSPIDRLEVFNAEDKKKQEELLLKYKKEGIRLEYELLAAQIELERAKARRSGKMTIEDEKLYAKYLALVETGKGRAKAAATSQTEATKQGIDLAELELKRLAVAQALNQQGEFSALNAERLRVSGLDILAVEEESLQTQRQIDRVNKDIDVAKKLTMDTSEQDLELAKLTTEQYKQRLEILDLIAARGARLAGEGMGIALQAGADTAERSDKLNDPDIALSSKIMMTQQIMSPMIETLESLGPDGEIMAAVTAGAFAMAEAYSMAFEIMNKEGATASQKLGASLLAVGATVNALANVMAASSRATIAGIESEIEAEKRRDGKSAASVAKLNALEKKKEKEKRKAFEQDKKMKMASTVINTATAVMAVMAEGGLAGFILGPIVAAIGAMQLAAIASTSYQGGGSQANAGPSKVSIGERSNSVDLATSRSPSGELSYMRGDQGLGGANNFVPSFVGRASGGNTALMVGEQGPELFIPERPGTVVPADDTADVARAIPNVNFNINTIDSQGMEEALMNQQGHIIDMIRQAANDHGEFFLENVDTMER